MRNTCVVDIGYGDAGKGALVDRLCARGDVGVVVRWNGGCQAQHNVIRPDGLHHTFSQFGAGTLQGVPTYLAMPVMVEPLSMLVEAAAVERVLGGIDPMRETWVSPACRLTTPYHWLVNRWQEDRRGDRRHGSCGRGIGMTAKFALDYPQLHPVVEDVAHPPTLEYKLEHLAQWALNETDGELEGKLPDRDVLMFDYQVWLNRVKLADASVLRDLQGDKRIVFEGAQGVLLDEHWGFHPHTTWSTVTPEWPREYCHAVDAELEVVGVTRAFSTRHGAGPMVSEDAELHLPEAHNKREVYQGEWRVGHFDLVATQYAARAAQVDSVYVTHLDTAYAEPRLKVCTRYEREDGAEQPILPLLSWDFKSRAAQTSRLFTAKPVIEARPYIGWGESIAELLDMPLCGVGMGPRTQDGVFSISEFAGSEG